MSLVDAAPAGAQRKPVAPATRSALVVGNVGKLGGELLNVLLESPRYGRVAVAVSRPLRVHVPKLETFSIPDDIERWHPAAGGPAPPDAFLCIEPQTKSFWKVAKPFVPIDSARAARLAARLYATGIRRLAVITPLEALLQMGAVPAIRDEDEMQIVNAGFERVLLLRPVHDVAIEAAQGFAAGVGNLVVRTLASTMRPSSLQPVRVRRAAQAAVDTLATMAGGVQIVGADRLRELIGDPLAPKV